uniref:Uncharacterized protein n=1 Tax=Rhizophora mucronata TaxID=61149 RepID=A0A2P2QBJ5_RHIMU
MLLINSSFIYYPRPHLCLTTIPAHLQSNQITNAKPISS